MELYLCLTVPAKSGTIYVGDLRGDAARRNGSVDPPAQCRYLRYPDVGTVAFSLETGTTYRPAHGVAAYLAARVQPGGKADNVATLTVAGVKTGDTVSFGALVLTAGTKEDAATNTFKDSATAGSDDASAASLAAVLNDATVLPILLIALGVTRAAVTAATNVVTIKTDPPVKVTPIVSSDPNHVVVGALAPPAVVPAADAYDLAAQAIEAYLRSAHAMTEADVNAAIATALPGSDLTAGGSLADLLSILAGRAFRLDEGTQLFDPKTKAWLGGPQVGSFTRPLHSSGYWIFPAHPGPTTKLVSPPAEEGPVRRTFPGSLVDSSILKGHLSRLTHDVALPGRRKEHGRVAVVYDQDGNVVA